MSNHDKPRPWFVAGLDIRQMGLFGDAEECDANLNSADVNALAAVDSRDEVLTFRNVHARPHHARTHARTHTRTHVLYMLIVEHRGPTKLAAQIPF